jgi:hypothetical protein
MACDPLTPTGARIYDSGWVDFSSLDTTNALGVGEPVAAEVLTLSGVMTTTEQGGTIDQVQVRLSTSSAQKPDLLVMLYTDAAPTTPVANTVYNGSLTNWIATIPIAEADYDRVADTAFVATVNPSYTFRTGTTANASNLYAVVLSNEGTPVTLATSATGSVRVWTKPGA